LCRQGALVPAAVANVVLDAIGVRLREVPFTPQRLLNALKAKDAVNQRI
jgi:CO/xanthine dehydrogenase Mo-binding subunit